MEKYKENKMKTRHDHNVDGASLLGSASFLDAKSKPDKSNWKKEGSICLPFRGRRFYTVERACQEAQKAAGSIASTVGE